MSTTNRGLLLFQSVTLILLVYLAISHRIIDAKTLTRRDTEDVGNSRSRSDEGEQIVEKIVRPIQERGADSPTVKKDLEEASKSQINAEATADLEAELEGPGKKSKKNFVGGKSRSSDPDMPSYDPFHTTTSKPSSSKDTTKAAVLEDQEDSTDEKSEPEKGSGADSYLEDKSSEGSRSEVDAPQTLVADSDNEQQAKSRSDELEVSDGNSRADSETTNTNSEEGSRSASEDSAGDSRSSDEATETPANADGSRAEEIEPDSHPKTLEHAYDSNSDNSSEKGKSRAGDNLPPKDIKPRRKHPKPNARPWYDPEKPTTTKPPPMTTDPPIATPLLTTSKAPTTTKLPATTKLPTTAKPLTTTKLPTTAKPPTTTEVPAITEPPLPQTTKKPVLTTKKPVTTTMKPFKQMTTKRVIDPNTTKSPEPTTTTKPPCDCNLVKDSDKLLAVVKTVRGGFKGRRINSVAIEKIMKGKLNEGQIDLIKQDKEITVSSNSSYVFPAGTYYFPFPIRFAGFISP